jgi:hypothetical protein
MTNPFEKPALMPDEDTKAKFDRMRRGLNDASIVEEADLAIIPDEALKAGIENVVRGPKKAPKPIELNTGARAMGEWQKRQEEKEDERWEKAA